MRKAGACMKTEVIVVDNCSTDGSREFFRNRFEEVRFIWNENNPGFAKACNQGLKLAKGEYVLFLNPDTIVPEDCFQKCIAHLQSNNNNGALGIRMVDGSGRYLKESKRGFPSALTSFFKLSGLAALFPRSGFFARYYMAHLDENKNHEVDVLAGAFMLMPKSIPDKVGGFDESFFMYAEDIDLSYRIRKAGYRNYYFAESTIIHFKGESTQKETVQYLETFYGAMEKFVRKHKGALEWGFYFVLIWALVFFKSILLRLSSKKVISDSSKAPEAFSVVGTEADATIVRSILEKNGLGINEYILRGTEEVKKIHSGKIVFCFPFVSYKDSIELMERLPNTVTCWFYSAGTRGMVSSNDRDKRGGVLEVEN